MSLSTPQIDDPKESKMQKFKKWLPKVIGSLWFFIPFFIIKSAPEYITWAYWITGVPILIVIVSLIYGAVKSKVKSKKVDKVFGGEIEIVQLPEPILMQVKVKGRVGSKIRKIVGIWLKVISIILYIGWGFWVLFAEAVIVNEVAGFWGIVIGITVAPITFLAAPIYAAVEWGQWLAVGSIFGGGIAISIIYWVSTLLCGDEY